MYKTIKSPSPHQNNTQRETLHVRKRLSTRLVFNQPMWYGRLSNHVHNKHTVFMNTQKEQSKPHTKQFLDNAHQTDQPKTKSNQGSAQLPVQTFRVPSK